MIEQVVSMNGDNIQILNASECRDIVRKSLKLRHDEEFLLKDFKVTRGSNELVGFMGEYYKLDAFIQQKNQRSDENERHLRYFIKSVPITNEFHRDECLRKGFFGKETRIYAEILCELQKFAPTKLVPVSYYTRKDIIVLEDLFASNEDFKHIEQNKEFSLEHHKIVLKHLSKLHAASLAWERADNFNIGERFGDVLYELQVTMANEWYVTGIKGIIFLAKMHPKFQAPEYQKFITEELYPILIKACALTDPSKKLRNVVCHRDTWDRNIFFKYDEAGLPIDCRIVDFQLSRYSPPGTDVLFFLFVTTTAERRKQIYGACLDYYYDCLVESLKQQKLSPDLITKEEFLQGCERVRLAVLIMWAICEPLMKMPEGLSNKMRKDEAEKFDFYMNTERNEFFTRIMEMDAGYEDIIMKPIEELIDYLYGNDEIFKESW